MAIWIYTSGVVFAYLLFVLLLTIWSRRFSVNFWLLLPDESFSAFLVEGEIRAEEVCNLVCLLLWVSVICSWLCVAGVVLFVLLELYRS